MVTPDPYRVLTNCMADVVTCHGRNGLVLFVSPVAESMFGAKIHDLMGRGLYDRVHLGDRPAFLSALSDCAMSGKSRSVEFRVRRDQPAGDSAMEFIWIEMRCSLLDQDFDPGHDAGDRQVVAVMREITERKARDCELAEAHGELDRVNAAKSRFLATMSHELRTPLNAIIGFSEMLTKKDALMIDAGRQCEYAKLINETGRHLLAVVNGILDMSKIENESFEIAPEPFAPGQVIEDCCDLLTLKARDANLDLVRCMPHGLPDIVADKCSFNQILINLISNAIKFTLPGGTISVGAKIDGECFVVTVEDTGVGIGAEDLPRIGDPYFQARSTCNRHQDGAGLGLSIVKGLLTLHGGTMHIDSRIGKGTRVTVHLPIDCESSRRNEGQAKGQAMCPPSPLPAISTIVRPSSVNSENRVKLSA
jgi:cell cycle sensor histidine kinase DivJ